MGSTSMFIKSCSAEVFFSFILQKNLNYTDLKSTLHQFNELTKNICKTETAIQ